MNKQQETIREMSLKKLLNGEQKKVLYKLFEAKIDAKIEHVKSVFNEAESDLQKRLEEQGAKDPAIKKWLGVIADSKKRAEDAENEIRKLGYTLNYHNELGVGHHKEADKLETKHRAQLSKMSELKMKLLADIYGVPMTYDEMTGYVEGEISKIEAE